MASRHSAFYTPLIATISAGFPMRAGIMRLTVFGEKDYPLEQVCAF
jgi:hypothetical protein